MHEWPGHGSICSGRLSGAIVIITALAQRVRARADIEDVVVYGMAASSGFLKGANMGRINKIQGQELDNLLADAARGVSEERIAATYKISVRTVRRYMRRNSMMAKKIHVVDQPIHPMGNVSVEQAEVQLLKHLLERAQAENINLQLALAREQRARK